MEIIKTSDGSHTLYSPQFNEVYHSRHGAIEESKHVFVKNGLQYLVEQGLKEVSIFEVGFGTGLNAILTLIAAEELAVKVHYETIELYPVPIDLITELNYAALLQNETQRDLYHNIHTCSWDALHEIAPGYTFKKIHASLIDSQLTTNNCQLIYFDAFGPTHQAEMWTVDIMRKLYGITAKNGVLVCYSSKSVFRRALREAGFVVSKPRGPHGKREMVRAVKSDS